MKCLNIDVSDRKTAVGVGIIFGVGVVAGWLLSYWHIFYVA